MCISISINEINVYPFIKWAGGKRSLLKKIMEYYPFTSDKTIAFRSINCNVYERERIISNF